MEDKTTGKKLTVSCDIYHCAGKYQVWVGNKHDIIEQLGQVYGHGHMKYVPNIEKLEKSQSPVLDSSLDPSAQNRPPLDPLLQGGAEA